MHSTGLKNTFPLCPADRRLLPGEIHFSKVRLNPRIIERLVNNMHFCQLSGKYIVPEIHFSAKVHLNPGIYFSDRHGQPCDTHDGHLQFNSGGFHFWGKDS